MSRRLLSARWAGLTLLALALVVAFVAAGLWQLSRAQAFLGSAPDLPPVDLSTLSPPAGALPDDAVGRRGTVTGTYDASHGFLVPDRSAAGGAGDGFWVVGLLRLGDGSGVCVLRGWTASATPAPAAPPTGRVTVGGRLEASEPPDGGKPPGTQLPSGQLAAINPVDLLDSVTYDVHDGYIVASVQQPADPAGLRAVHADPPGTTVPGYFWQHASYVALWWLFALFVVAFWVRLVRDELRGDSVPMVGSDGSPAPG